MLNRLLLRQQETPMEDSRKAKWRALSVVAGVVVVGFCVVATAVFSEQKKPSRSADDSATQHEQALQRLEEQLDQVLANQQQLFTRFDQVMEELRIIKIRATIKR